VKLGQGILLLTLNKFGGTEGDPLVGWVYSKKFNPLGELELITVAVEPVDAKISKTGVVTRDAAAVVSSKHAQAQIKAIGELKDKKKSACRSSK